MLHIFRLFAILLLSVMILSGPVPHPTYAETQPTIRMISVDYPHTVLPGAAFRVKINAWYSAAFLSDIGVWDVGSGLVVESMTFISQFTGPGNVSFTLSLIAPKAQGLWHLIALNRVWWQNAWYQDPKGGEEAFTVTVSNTVTLTLGAVGAGAQVLVDGYTYEIQNGSFVSALLKPGAHVFTAPMIILPSTGQRSVFVGWSDGVNSNPRSIFLTAPTTIYALYRTEFYLSVQSVVGQTAGGGWYAKGMEANVAVTPTAVTDQFGVVDDYRFTGWSGASDSESNLLVLTMDGPKQVNATWVNTGRTIDSNALTDALLLCCLPLLGRLAFVSLRRRKVSSTRHTRSPSRVSIVFLLAVLALPLLFPLAHAQSLPQPRASIVRIGDAEWYYWAHPGSDTCLIWLGGGVPEQTEPGSYAYFINPFGYESFDTMRFIQDLANYYCILALQQGSLPWTIAGANRTISQELFQPESTMMEEVHTWIAGQGYAHTFVVGYSVGGQAAVADLTLTHPADWTTEDGIILITVPFSQDVINNARELRANLFIIYGGNLPDYEASGIEFYNKTQSEGFPAAGYFHKEFHVIDDVGHEVWTVRATGAYDRRALNLIIGFIEKSKTLQVTHGFQSPFLKPLNMTTASILSVQAPLSVNAGEAFLVESNVSFTASPKSMILVAYVPGEAGILSEVSLISIAGASVSVSMVIAPISKSVKLSLSFVVLQNSDGNWVQASAAYSKTVTVSDLVRLTVQTSIPSVSFSFDGTEYATNSSGLVQIPTVMGQHLIEAQPFIYLSNVSRLRFVGWGDSASGTPRQIGLNGDEAIELSYVGQYFVEVSSPYGLSNGSGWYDANSTASTLVQPPILNSPSVIFSHWASYGNQSQVRLLLPVSSPQVISAVWDAQNSAPLNLQTLPDPMLILSIVTLIALVILNVILPTRRVGLEAHREKHG